MPPKFSIIIPVYNVEPYLRECLDSVLAQTFADWEAICVDDGSTDGSGAILDEYAAKDPRFRVLHQKNAGVGQARNAGLEVAKGTWIGFLDADDVWHCEFLSGIVSAMAQYPDCKLFRCGMARYKDGEVCDFGKDVPKFNLVDWTRTIPLDALENHYFWEHVYHRDLIGSVRFPRYIRGEDRVFFSSIALGHCDQIAVSEAPRYGYRQREGSAVNSCPSKQALLDEMDHRIDIIRQIDPSGKTVDYAGDYWLEGYLLWGVLFEFRNHPDATELRTEWLRRLRALSPLARYSPRGRFVLWCRLRPLFSIIPKLRYDFMM